MVILRYQNYIDSMRESGYMFSVPIPIDEVLAERTGIYTELKSFEMDGEFKFELLGIRGQELLFKRIDRSNPEEYAFISIYADVLNSTLMVELINRTIELGAQKAYIEMSKVIISGPNGNLNRY